MDQKWASDSSSLHKAAVQDMAIVAPHSLTLGSSGGYLVGRFEKPCGPCKMNDGHGRLKRFVVADKKIHA